jgi:carotenoid 1,2-hydratase
VGHRPADLATVFWSRVGLGGPRRGRFRLTPSAPGVDAPVELGRSAAGEAHSWQVRVPNGRITVEFEQPAFRFSGRGYHDSNWGEGRLEHAFARWSWARFHEQDGSRILYAFETRDGARRACVVEAHPGGATVARPGLPARFGATERTGWGLHAPRGFAIDDAAAGEASVVRWLDRTPFYARYVARLRGPTGIVGVGEYLDLDRYQDPAVQFLLRWRGRRP